MRALDAEYPGYGFAQHKGYPVEAHASALKKLGACPVHRRSFALVREALGLPRCRPGRRRRRSSNSERSTVPYVGADQATRPSVSRNIRPKCNGGAHPSSLARGT